MPNSRRRKFSVQNNISSGRNRKNSAESVSQSNPSLIVSSIKARNSTSPNYSKASETLEIVAETIESNTSALTFRRKHSTVDKDVTVSSSNIDVFNLLSAIDDSSVSVSTPVKRDARPTEASRKEKPRQHRVKVRSPKRCMTIVDAPKIDLRTVATSAINWEREFEIYNIISPVIVETELTACDDRSEHSSDDMCRICHGGESMCSEFGRLISACNCRGTVGRVHVKCLERWLTESGKSRCELCGTRYATRRVHRYGVPRALVMWILSQNAKQLMVDSLGIMLMSPLAVLAAWLSGRTLAGLMTQEGHKTPWPLASTFVLACMTLVCYYCWIVSAATRHALGWWIWYRSQYEVRLQLLDGENPS